MEITSSQRAYLRGKAQTLNPIVMVGKDGFTDAVVLALDQALHAHELVKVRFQQHKDEVKDCSIRLSSATSSLLVATTGFTAVFFRQDEEDEDKQIYHLSSYNTER